MKNFEYLKLFIGVVWVIFGILLLLVYFPDPSLPIIPPFLLFSFMAIMGGVFLITNYKRTV